MRFLPVLLDNIMTLKITNDFNLILNKDDYQAFVNANDLLSLHCPVCGVVGNVIKLRNDEPSRYYCLDGVFI